MRGLGTVINVVAILIGSGLGVLLGGRLPERTRTTVTDALGLVTLVIGGLNLTALRDPALTAALGSGGTLLVVLAALLTGGILGSLLQIEKRLEAAGGWLQGRLSGARGGAGGQGAGSPRARFIEGFVSASLVFCIGPLAILGPVSDGLGRGIDILALKSTLDGFASLAFAAALGWGVAASALSVGLLQGTMTVLALGLGEVMTAPLIAALTATGGVLLLGVGLRLLGIRAVAVGDLLPALLIAPLLTAALAR